MTLERVLQGVLILLMGIFGVLDVLILWWSVVSWIDRKAALRRRAYEALLGEHTSGPSGYCLRCEAERAKRSQPP